MSLPYTGREPILTVSYRQQASLLAAGRFSVLRFREEANVGSRTGDKKREVAPLLRPCTESPIVFLPLNGASQRCPIGAVTLPPKKEKSAAFKDQPLAPGIGYIREWNF
jgi:hypothetical protein